MIGNRVRELRESRGITQTQLARILWISTKALKNWEQNLSDPSVENLINLARYFNVSVDHLIGIEEHCVIILDSLPEYEREKLRAMIQVYIDMTNDEKYV